MTDSRFVSSRQRTELKRLLAERDWRNEPNEDLRKATEVVAGLLAASGDVTQGDTGVGFPKRLNEQHKQATGREFLARHATSLISYLQRMPKRSEPGKGAVAKAIFEAITTDDEAAVAAEQKRPGLGTDKVAWENVKRQIRESGRKQSDGFYQLPDGRIYKVQLSGKGNLYGKILTVHKQAVWTEDGSLIEPAEIEWVYEVGAMSHIRPEHKMTEEQARAYGKLYGRCYECSRTLRNELSIHLGIGPVCGSREFGGQFKQKVYDAEIALGLRDTEGRKIRSSLSKGKK